MSLARRRFLKSGVFSAFSAAAAVIAPSQIFAQKGMHIQSEAANNLSSLVLHQDSVLSYTRQTFEQYIGDVFGGFTATGEIVGLKLTNLSDYKVQQSTRITVRKTVQPKTFSLTFESRGRLSPFTSIQRLNHPRLGDFSLFMTSYQQEDGLFTYEAVISHF